MNLRGLFIFLFLSAGAHFHAQELTCNIDINYSQIQGSANKQIFDQMKNVIYQFMNGTKWTNEIFTQQEKIECSFLIIIKEVIGTDEYSGSIQVTSRRPIYKSSYYSTVLNVEDENLQFKFQQFTQLEYNINTFQNNLTAILQYYAYIVIAADYDTFAPLGGAQYWQKAQQIVQTAVSSSETGWKNTGSTTSQKNRYWLVENTIQPVFKGIRDCMYEYHRNGLDKMYESPEEGRAVILASFDNLMAVYKARPASYNMQVFFNSKRDEIINIFKGASPEEKTKVLEILTTIDPAGTTQYQKITG